LSREIVWFRSATGNGAAEIDFHLGTVGLYGPQQLGDFGPPGILADGAATNFKGETVSPGKADEFLICHRIAFLHRIVP
jgi:hypothetical protein